MDIIISSKARRKQKPLFQFFYYQWVDELLEFSKKYLERKDITEEIVNDVLLNTWERFDKNKSILNLRAYLYSGVKHRIINYLTRNKERENISIDYIPESNIQFIENPEEILIAYELQ